MPYLQKHQQNNVYVTGSSRLYVKIFVFIIKFYVISGIMKQISSNQIKNMSFCSFSKGEIYRNHFEPGKKVNQGFQKYSQYEKFHSLPIYLFRFSLEYFLIQVNMFVRNVVMSCSDLKQNMNTKLLGQPLQKQFFLIQQLKQRKERVL